MQLSFNKQGIPEEHEGPHPVDTSAMEGQVDITEPAAYQVSLNIHVNAFP
jgi:hypothetical protein